MNYYNLILSRMDNNTTYTADCHCGKISCVFEAPNDVEVLHCNCSMCKRYNYHHLIVKKNNCTLELEAANLATYCFNTGAAKHYFCSNCGVKPFYVPRSHPDCYSINLFCVSPEPKNIVVVQFDGLNWEKGINSITF